MKAHACERCGQRIFFENTRCENCGATLGFDADALRMRAFEVSAEGVWTSVAEAGDVPPLRPCANYVNQNVCNWLVAGDDPNPLCRSCRTTRVLPDLGKPENRDYWGAIEAAKRRMVYSLLALGLPLPGKGEDFEHGVAFEFLEELTPTFKVLTGHDDGVITLNIAEADDAQRERLRHHLHEPARTLLGHFRHEIGHYYWDRLVRGTSWEEPFRALFGDERQDYAAALHAHYQSPKADWMSSFVSVYASSHPWEDWAECWAHYLHMLDGLETAEAWGLELRDAVPGTPPVKARALTPGSKHLERNLVQNWLPVSQFVNAMARSLGAHDSYPFVVPTPVIDKLSFIHDVIRAAVRGEVPMNFTPAIPAEDPVPQTSTTEPSPA